MHINVNYQNLQKKIAEKNDSLKSKFKKKKIKNVIKK
jgi:hypothetical protein